MHPRRRFARRGALRATAAAAVSALLTTAAWAGAPRPDACGSHLDPERCERIRDHHERGDYDLALRAGADVYVPIVFHVIRRSDGTGGITPTQLDDVFANLNSIYANTGVQFCRQEAQRTIESDTYYSGLVPGAAYYLSDLIELVQDEWTPNAINVFLPPRIHEATPYGLLGVALFPGVTFPIPGPCVIVSTEVLLDPKFHAALAHEVGHFFDLLHTFEDAFGVECSDGVGCDQTGDLLCDTPADANDDPINPPMNGDCLTAPPDAPRNTCQLSSYAPPIGNIMSYYFSSECPTRITPEQSQRILACLHNLRPELLGHCVPPCGVADIASPGECHSGAADGRITLSDFACFIDLWTAGDPRADLTETAACGSSANGGSGVDLFDYACFLSAYSQGCE